MFNRYSITKEIVKLNVSCWIENESQTVDLKKVFNIDKGKLEMKCQYKLDLLLITQAISQFRVGWLESVA